MILIKDPSRSRLLWNKQKSGLLLIKGFLSFLSSCLAFGCLSFSFLCFFFSISYANFPNASKLIKKRISLTVCVFYLSIIFAEFLFILQMKFQNSEIQTPFYYLLIFFYNKKFLLMYCIDFFILLENVKINFIALHLVSNFQTQRNF